MKKHLTIIPILLITLIYSSTSYAEWTKVGRIAQGEHYVDFDRIRKHDGYVYFWELQDLLKPTPTEYGSFSRKLYLQGDCKLFRFKNLSYSFHKEPMGEGTGLLHNPDEEWKYPPPESIENVIGTEACDPPVAFLAVTVKSVS